MSSNEYLLEVISQVSYLVLSLVYVGHQFLFALPVACCAGTGDHVERALNMVAGVFHSALSDERHVAVGAGYPALAVNAHLE